MTTPILITLLYLYVFLNIIATIELSYLFKKSGNEDDMPLISEKEKRTQNMILITVSLLFGSIIYAIIKIVRKFN